MVVQRRATLTTDSVHQVVGDLTSDLIIRHRVLEDSVTTTAKMIWRQENMTRNTIQSFDTSLLADPDVI